MITPNQAKELGSFGIWLLKFLVPIVLLGIGIAIIPEMVSLPGLLFVGLLIIGGGLVSDSLAYGYAGEEGIRFRRWIRQEFLPWDKVAFVVWFPSILTVCPKDITLRCPKIDFPIASLPWHAFAQLWGYATPEVVQWFEQQEKLGRPGFPELRTGYYAWEAANTWKASLRSWLGLLLFVLAFLLPYLTRR